MQDSSGNPASRNRGAVPWGVRGVLDVSVSTVFLVYHNACGSGSQDREPSWAALTPVSSPLPGASRSGLRGEGTSPPGARVLHRVGEGSLGLMWVDLIMNASCGRPLAL